MIHLFNDYVGIQEKPVEKTTGGILLGTDVDMENPIGVVKIVGPDVTKVAVGDEVFYKRHMFDQVSFENELYFIGAVEGIYGKND